MTAVKVLSIDGGGIKGIIPATVLAYIEEQTGKPISELFDLIAGTSTGGIIALGLTRPGSDGKPMYTAASGIDLYVKEGPVIFAQRFPRTLPFWQFFEERYPSGPLENRLDTYFGDSRLADALTDVIVTSYDIGARKPHFFKTRHARTQADANYLMRDAAWATSAAPTYFEPAKIDSNADPAYLALIDGGVFAINPAMCAFAEVRDVDPTATDVLLVSLGTGENTDPLSYDEVKGWGEASWARPILDVVFDGISDTVDFQLRQLLPGVDGLARYYRFQTRLEGASDAMDDASPKNLEALQQLGNELVASEKTTLDALCAQLTAA